MFNQRIVDNISPTSNCFCTNINSCSGFSIFHQNVRSVRKNFDSLLTHLSSSNHLPDLIFISEIWIYSYEQDSYQILGYTFTTSYNDSYSAGGVGVFYKNSFKCSTQSLNLISADLIILNCEIDRVSYSIIGVYRLLISSF